jgi:diaminopimelate decarboxylase
MNMQETKVERLTNLLGGVIGSELLIGEVPINKIVEKSLTPAYIYNGDVIANQVQRVLNALGPETQLVFSIKSNPSIGVCQVIAQQGIGCEVASIGELILAQKAGFPADKTLFIGPGKTDEELELAVELGIEAIIVESMGELQRVADIAYRMSKVMNVGVRLNIAAQVKGYGMRMGGGSQQFGVDEEKLPELVERFKDNPNINLVGLHVYAGSQQFDVEALVQHCNYVVDLGIEMAGFLGRPLQMMDLGGGFGVPYFEKENEFDLEGFGEQFQQVIERCKSNPGTSTAQVVIELGRYLVAESGIYITRVLDIKESRGKKYVIADGGMNHHIAGTGNFGQVFRKPYPIVVANRMNEPLEQEVAIVGPNCTPLDIFAQNIESRRVEVGDLIGVFYSGAYGYSASSLGFLSHPTPAEVIVRQGKTYMLREPGRVDRVLEGQYGLDTARELVEGEPQPVHQGV